jgi:hypothetical protein
LFCDGSYFDRTPAPRWRDRERAETAVAEDRKADGGGSRWSSLTEA